MMRIKDYASALLTGAFFLAVICLAGPGRVRAQGEKRTVFTEQDFHWQGHMKPGQTLEVINQNGEVEAAGASGDEARAGGTKRGSDDNDLFVEVVEYADGVTVCAVYAKEKTPGRCHRGGVSSESRSWSWHGNRGRINFDMEVPKGVRFRGLTTNGNVRGHNLGSVVEAETTNGNVEVSTSEWVSASTTNGGVRVSMGSANWSGDLRETTTNGSVEVTLPAAAEFKLDAATTNGGINTDFPITVQGSFSSKRLSGTVGGGGRDLRVATTNGSIKLTKS